MLNQQIGMHNPDLAYWTIQYYDRYIDTLDEFIENQQEQRETDKSSRSLFDIFLRIKTEGKL